MIKQKQRFDWGVLAATLLLTGFGIVFVYSSSFPIANQKFGGSDFFLVRQLIRVIIALVCMIVFMKLDYHILGKASVLLTLIIITLLVAVLLQPDSSEINGAKRWLDLGFFKFQVSELARIVILIIFSKRLADIGDRIRDLKVFMIELLRISVIAGLILLEPDFSTAFIFVMITLALFFVAGAKVTHLASLALMGIPMVIMLIGSFSYRKERIMGYLNLAENKAGAGYQLNQALIGLGSGGVSGVGLGEASQKNFYLPEPHTDFAFSVIGEELGFIGLVILFLIMIFLVYRGLKISFSAPDKQGAILAFGICFVISIYTLLHAAVNTGIVPTTGVPFPFVSYGGMSLIINMSAIGILLNISSQSKSKLVNESYKPGNRITR